MSSSSCSSRRHFLLSSLKIEFSVCLERKTNMCINANVLNVFLAEVGKYDVVWLEVERSVSRLVVCL